MLRTAKRNFAIFMAWIISMMSLYIAPVQAEPLINRRVHISNSTQGATTSNNFIFTIPSFTDLGSIQFEYCENSPLPEIACVAPAGLSVSGAVLSSQTGETGFSILAPPSSNKIILTRTPTAASALPVTYNFDNVVNPSEANKAVYVRISTYASDDATGPVTDSGSVVFSTAQNIAVSGYVPPYIIFCVGVTVDVKCRSTSGSQLDFGELVSSQTRAVTSEYSGSTNDPGGFTTTLTGVTMTSGTNTIAPLSTADASRPGQSQFGLNLRDNSSPNVGTEPAGSGTSIPTGQASNPNQFFFGNDVISASALSTDFTKFTVSYIANVSASQPPGIYNTTVTYIAVAAF